MSMCSNISSIHQNFSKGIHNVSRHYIYLHINDKNARAGEGLSLNKETKDQRMSTSEGLSYWRPICDS